MGNSSADNFFFLGILTLVALGIAWKARRYFQMRKWNLAWYRAEFPHLVGKDGRVTCYSCGSSNIGTERLMEGMYMRRHLCRQCGTTLYYSPEN